MVVEYTLDRDLEHIHILENIGDWLQDEFFGQRIDEEQHKFLDDMLNGIINPKTYIKKLWKHNHVSSKRYKKEYRK